MQSGFLLDVVVFKGTTIFELFPGKNQSLLVYRGALLVAYLGFDILDAVTGLDLKRDRLPREGFDEDLHCVCLCDFL